MLGLLVVVKFGFNYKKTSAHCTALRLFIDNTWKSKLVNKNFKKISEKQWLNKIIININVKYIHQ